MRLILRLQRFKQNSKRLPQRLCALAAPAMPESYYDEIVRRNDHRKLAIGPGHVVSLLRHRISAGAVDPEEPTVNRPLVRFPGGSDCADKLEKASGRIRFPFHTPPEDGDSKAGPVMARSDFVTLLEEVSIRIGLQHHRADPDLQKKGVRLAILRFQSNDFLF